MKKNNKTIYQFIVDESGSMSDCKTETISGFNAQLNRIQALQVEHPDEKYLISVTTFNDRVEYPINHQEAKAIQLLSTSNYKPNGYTALLDAIGFSINRIEGEFGKMIEENLASVVVIILTDGHENCSKHFNYHQIAKKISKLEATENWKFTFLGADFDATLTSKMLNIQEKNVVSFNKSNFDDSMDRLGMFMERSVTSKRAGVMDFSIEEDFRDQPRKDDKDEPNKKRF